MTDNEEFGQAAYVPGTAVLEALPELRELPNDDGVAKLYHLFSLGVSDSDIKLMMEKNVAGELTE